MDGRIWEEKYEIAKKKDVFARTGDSTSILALRVTAARRYFSQPLLASMKWLGSTRTPSLTPTVAHKCFIVLIASSPTKLVSASCLAHGSLIQHVPPSPCSISSRRGSASPLFVLLARMCPMVCSLISENSREIIYNVEHTPICFYLAMQERHRGDMCRSR